MRGLNDCTMKGKYLKRKFHSISDDTTILSNRRNINHIMLSLSYPSYSLRVGSKKVRTESRNRLCYLLRSFVIRGNWVEASGILSVLLQGTCRDRSPALNQFKYWVTMELLKCIEIDKINPTKNKLIYETWMRRIGPMKRWPVEDRFFIKSEFIIFSLCEQNFWAAQQTALCLMQECDFGKDPKSCLAVGLTYYQLWYSSIPREMQLKYSDEYYAPKKPEKFRNFIAENYTCSDALSLHDADPMSQCYSYASVMNNREIPVSSDADSLEKRPVMFETEVKRENSIPTNCSKGFYFHSENSSDEEEEATGFTPSDNLLYSSIFSGQGEWDLCLLPLRLPNLSENFENFMSLHKQIFDDYKHVVNNDDFKQAVKYLRLALHSTHPESAALHFLIQLLLLRGQAQEAVDEIDKFAKLCCSSDMALFFKVRENILEHLNDNKTEMCSSVLEDKLRRVPTCSTWLAELVSIHQNGDYSVESLLEMIAMHLDATNGDHKTWREFALCFYKLFHYDEDQTSTNLDGNKTGFTKKCSVGVLKIPKVFRNGKSGEDWSCRCRWWINTHFRKNILASEIAAGDLQLVGFKAVCASFMYGQTLIYYLGKAMEVLKETIQADSFRFFQRYAHQGPGILSSLFTSLSKNQPIPDSTENPKKKIVGKSKIRKTKSEKQKPRKLEIRVVR